MSRWGAIAGAAVIALAVIGALPVVRLLVALIEIVKGERERERDTEADLRLGRVLKANQEAAYGEQNEKRFHTWNLGAARDSRIWFLPLMTA